MKPLFTAITALSLLLPLSLFAAPNDDQMQSIAAARAEYSVGRAAVSREDWDAALAAFNRAVQLDPYSAEIHNMIGFTLRQQGELDPAIKHYFKALELNPYHRGAHEYLGRAYLRLGQVDKASALLVKLDEMCSPTCPERDALRKAINEFDQWQHSVRGQRRY